MRSARLGLVLAAIGGVAAGCGSDAGPPIALNVEARWNNDPGTAGDIGFELWVDFGWPSRHESCFPRPADLTVTVDGRDFIPDARGDCEWDIFLVVPAIPSDRPVDVRVSSGSHVYGEAIYENMFPNIGAQLVPAGDGTIHSGSSVSIQFPGVQAGIWPDLAWGQFYWLDSPPGAVPFYTYAPGTLAADMRSAQVTAPSLTGRASLIVDGNKFLDPMQTEAYAVASTCTGFTSCIGTPALETAGPISVTIVP